MTNAQFYNYLLRLAQCARCTREFLENALTHDLDTQVRGEYGVDIESIILDLSNVSNDCIFVARLMRMSNDIEL